MSDLLGIQRAPFVARAHDDRASLEHRLRRLAWIGNAWHVFEFGIALAAGIAAGSIALVGFGADSLIEVAAGTVIIWLFTGGRRSSPAAERHAQRVIAASFLILAAYIAVASTYDLLARDKPAVSWLGIALAAVTALMMPLLARAKRRLGRRLDSSAAVKEAAQNQLCAYLSIALLAGLLLNAAAGWWWADPLAALVIAAIAVREGRASWRGESCCDAC